MLSINIYKYILKKYFDLEEYVLKYTTLDYSNDDEYVHECPFCHEHCLYVEAYDKCSNGWRYDCYECNIRSEDIIDFNSRIKHIDKYKSMIELFYELKQKNNAENMPDYEFAVSIVKSTDCLYEDYVEHLKNYNLNESYKEKCNNEEEYIDYLINNASYEDVDLELLNNNKYLERLWKYELKNFF